MKPQKKNAPNVKGGKNANINSKLSEDMVSPSLFSKTKSKTPSPSTTAPTQDSSIAKTSEASSATLHTPK